MQVNKENHRIPFQHDSNSSCLFAALLHEDAPFFFLTLAWIADNGFVYFNEVKVEQSSTAKGQSLKAGSRYRHNMSLTVLKMQRISPGKTILKL